MYAIKTVFQDNVIIHEAIRTLINIKIKHENEGGKGGGGVKSYETPHYTWDVSHRNWDEPSEGKTSHYHLHLLTMTSDRKPAQHYLKPGSGVCIDMIESIKHFAVELFRRCHAFLTVSLTWGTVQLCLFYIDFDWWNN